MTRPTTRQTVRAMPPVAGNAAALPGLPVDSMAEAVAIIEELLALYLDADAPASRERPVVERARGFLVRAGRRGGRP